MQRLLARRTAAVALRAASVVPLGGGGGAPVRYMGRKATNRMWFPNKKEKKKDRTQLERVRKAEQVTAQVEAELKRARADDPIVAQYRSLRKRAKDGDREAQMVMGTHFMFGSGPTGERDPALSRKWLKRAADQGEPAACYLYGAGLLDGFAEVGVAVDETPERLADERRAAECEEEAVRLWEKGAAAGSPHCQFALCERYLKGDRPEDRQRAFELAKAAGEGGIDEGFVVAGGLLISSEFEGRDTAQALELFLRVAEKGEQADAMLYAGMIYADETQGLFDPEAAAHWLSEAAARGNIDAPHVLHALEQHVGAGEPEKKKLKPKKRHLKKMMKNVNK